jgi:hypothetical protein
LKVYLVFITIKKYVVKILHSLGFHYQQTQIVPGKADAQAQQAHVAAFKQLMAEKQDDTLVFFQRWGASSV